MNVSLLSPSWVWKTLVYQTVETQPLDSLWADKKKKRNIPWFPHRQRMGPVSVLGLVFSNTSPTPRASAVFVKSRLCYHVICAMLRTDKGPFWATPAWCAGSLPASNHAMFYVMCLYKYTEGLPEEPNGTLASLCLYLDLSSPLMSGLRGVSLSSVLCPSGHNPLTGC